MTAFTTVVVIVMWDTTGVESDRTVTAVVVGMIVVAVTPAVTTARSILMSRDSSLTCGLRSTNMLLGLMSIEGLISCVELGFLRFSCLYKHITLCKNHIEKYNNGQHYFMMLLNCRRRVTEKMSLRKLLVEQVI